MKKAVKKLMWDYLSHMDDAKKEENQKGFTTKFNNKGVSFKVQSIDICPIDFSKGLYFHNKN